MSEGATEIRILLDYEKNAPPAIYRYGDGERERERQRDEDGKVSGKQIQI